MIRPTIRTILISFFLVIGSIATAGNPIFFGQNQIVNPSGVTQTIALVGSPTTGTTGAGSLVLSVPTGTQGGDLLVAMVSFRNAPTITTPTGWVLVRTDTSTGTNKLTQAVYHRIVSPPEPASYQWNASTSENGAGVIISYSGTDNSNPIDIHGGLPTNASGTIIAPTVSVTSTTGRLIGFYGLATGAAGSTISLNAGLTSRANLFAAGTGSATSKINIAAGDNALTASGATGNINSTSATTTVDNIGQQIVIKPGTGAASRLAFSTQPSASVITGQALAQQPIIQIQDSSGTLVSSSAASVTLSAYSDANCSTLASGTLSAATNPLNSTSGQASFSGVSYSGGIGNIYLLASTAGYRSACSSAISVTTGPAYQLALTVQPFPISAKSIAFADQPQITIQDQWGNTVTTANNSITLAAYTDSTCQTSATAGTLGATTNPLAATSGIATFAGVNYSAAATIYLQATATGLLSVCSQAVQITNCTAPKTIAATGSYVVPAGCTSVTIKAWGGGGGGGQQTIFSNGGTGGFSRATISVTPGETLTIAIAGGGLDGGTANNGGTEGGAKGSGGAGGGGGHSSVKRSTTYLIAAGGGGGGGASIDSAGTGGNGGGSIGGSGQSAGSGNYLGYGGGEGTQSTGGAGGANVGGYATMAYGADGTPGNGGDGGSYNPHGGGGGGGGYYGGGGGNGGNGGGCCNASGGAGGGGGSGYTISGATNVINIIGIGTDSDYTSGTATAGIGSATAATAGGGGRVVIYPH